MFVRNTDTLFPTSTWGCASLNITSIENRWRRRRMPSDAKKRRHQGEAAESEEEDATPDTTFETSDATYVERQMKHLKHTS